MELNKNISVWRGNNIPPTDYHLWEKEDGSLHTKINEEWLLLTSPLDKSTLDRVELSVDNHLRDTNNPHKVTKALIGLDKVTNDALLKRAELGVASGVASLDSTGKVPLSLLPSYVDDFIIKGNTIKTSEIDFTTDTLQKFNNSISSGDHVIRTQYSVVDNTYNNIVGQMLLIGDSMGHMVTEILTTSATLKNGVIDWDAHSDTEVNTYIRRNHVKEGGTSSIAVGSWSKWTYYSGEGQYNDFKKLVAGELNKKVNTSDIVQQTGDSTTSVMSLKAVTDAIQVEIDRATAAEQAIIYDVSSHNNGAVFESLQTLLSSSNLSTLIPTSVRCGGMNIRFVRSSDNKYVQYRLMSTSFSTNEANWQGDAIMGTDRIADGAVTLDKLCPDLQPLIANIGKNAVFAGIATPTTNPGTPNGPVFYIANGNGTYNNFGGIEVTENGVVILYYDTAWHKVATGIASNEKLAELEKRMGFYIVFNAIPKLKLNVLEVPIKRGDEFILEGTESGRGYYAYYVNDASSSDYIQIENGVNVAQKDIVAIYVGFTSDNTKPESVLKISAKRPFTLESLLNDSNLKIGFLAAYGTSKIDIKISERKLVFPKDWVIIYRGSEKSNSSKYFTEPQIINLFNEQCQAIYYDTELDKLVAKSYHKENEGLVFLFTINISYGRCSLPNSFYTVNGKNVGYDDTEIKNNYEKLKASLELTSTEIDSIKKSLIIENLSDVTVSRYLDGYYLPTSAGTPISYNSYAVTKPILVKAGEKITAKVSCSEAAAIASVELDENASTEQMLTATFTPLVIGNINKTRYYEYENNSEQNIYVVVSGAIFNSVKVGTFKYGTFEELNERIKALENDKPNSFATYEAKLTFERFARWKGYDDCIIFPVLTDLHPINNVDKYKLLGYLIETDNVFGYDFIAHLGDVGDNTDTIQTESTALEKIAKAANLLGEYKGRILFSQGNHDTVDSDGTNSTFNRSVVENYLMMPTLNRYPNEFVMNIEHQVGYYDIACKKVRIVILNTSDIQDSYFETHSSKPQYNITKEQMVWLVDVLQNTPNEYNVVMLSHWCPSKIGEWLNYLSDSDKYALGYTTHAETLVTIMEAFANKTSGSVNDVNYNFTNVNAKLVGLFSGDSHMDASLAKDETKVVKKQVAGVVSDVSISGNGVNYIVFQGFGGIAEASIPSWGRYLKVNPLTELLFDVVAIKPQKGEIKIFRIGKGGVSYDREFTF